MLPVWWLMVNVFGNGEGQRCRSIEYIVPEQVCKNVCFNKFRAIFLQTKGPSTGIVAKVGESLST